jgi:hypothetical protein
MGVGLAHAPNVNCALVGAAGEVATVGRPHHGSARSHYDLQAFVEAALFVCPTSGSRRHLTLILERNFRLTTLQITLRA